MAGRCRTAHAANRRIQASNLQTPPYSALHRGAAWPLCAHSTGALLPHHFTSQPDLPVCCVLSVALSRGFPRWTLSSTPSTVSGLSSRTHAWWAPAATRAAHEVYRVYSESLSSTSRLAILLRSMGNGLAKWHAARCPTATCWSGGSSSEHMGNCAIGQRVWNRQPVGG